LHRTYSAQTRRNQHRQDVLSTGRTYSARTGRTQHRQCFDVPWLILFAAIPTPCCCWSVPAANVCVCVCAYVFVCVCVCLCVCMCMCVLEATLRWGVQEEDDMRETICCIPTHTITNDTCTHAHTRTHKLNRPTPPAPHALQCQQALGSHHTHSCTHTHNDRLLRSIL